MNEGTIRAVDGPALNIFAMAFENSGLIHSPAERTLSISSSFTRAENSGTLQVDGSMGFNAPAGLHNSDEGLIDVRGQLTLEQTVLRIRPNGMIVGDGEIMGAISSGPLVVNEGIVEPGEGFATLHNWRRLSAACQWAIADGDRRRRESFE